MSATFDSAARAQSLSADVMAVVRASSAARQSWFGRVIQPMIAKLRTAMAVRRAEAELMALDDRLLADIGIQRAEIHTALAAANANTRPHRAA